MSQKTKTIMNVMLRRRKGNGCLGAIVVVLVAIYFIFFSTEKKFTPVYSAQNSNAIKVQWDAKGQTSRLDLAAIKAPKIAEATNEQDEPLAQDAKKFIEDSLKSNDIKIEEASSHRWDRYVYVWLAPPPDSSDAVIRKTMLNALMISKGYAKFDPKAINDQKGIVQPYRRVFEELQKEAQQVQIGIWSLPENSPEALKKKAEAEAQAAKQKAEEERRARITWLKEQNTVVVTPNGKKYHRSSCKTVKGSYQEMTVKQALARGYERCNVCYPPDHEITMEEEDFPTYK